MTEIVAISSKLVQREDGVWVAPRQDGVSYPEEGNEACFAVEDASFWFRHRNNVIRQLVRRFSPSSVFFDIGGGNGCVSRALQSAGTEVVLVEPGPIGARNARRRGIRTVIQSTLQGAGFARQSIPAAGLFDVVEHIEDDAAFLRLVSYYLEPRGTLYVTVPALPFLWSNDDVRAGHFRRYTRDSLSALLRQCGFDVLYCSYFFSFLVVPILIFRSVPSWFGFRKSVTPATTRREHTGGVGFVRGFVGKLLRSEVHEIGKGRPIRFGSSCIAVAGKRA